MKTMSPKLTSNLQVGVFAKCLLHSAKAQLSGQISKGGEELVDTQGQRLHSNGIGHLLYQLRIEGTAHGDWGVEDGGIEGKETVKALALDEGRYT